MFLIQTVEEVYCGQLNHAGTTLRGPETVKAVACRRSLAQTTDPRCAYRQRELRLVESHKLVKIRRPPLQKRYGRTRKIEGSRRLFLPVARRGPKSHSAMGSGRREARKTHPKTIAKGSGCNAAPLTNFVLPSPRNSLRPSPCPGSLGCRTSFRHSRWWRNCGVHQAGKP